MPKDDLKWRDNFPLEIRNDLFEILCKAIVCKSGSNSISFTRAEMHDAAIKEAQAALDEDGNVYFRIKPDA